MNKYDPPPTKNVCVSPRFSGITLKYECDCGKWALEAHRHCKHCGRENPYWEEQRHYQFGFSISPEKSATMPNFKERKK